MSKYATYLKNFAIVIGIVLILAGFRNDADFTGNRALYFFLGASLICIAMFETLRNMLISFTFLGAGISGLGALIDSAGKLDFSRLLTIALCIGIAIYFGKKVVGNFPAMRFPHLSGVNLAMVDNMTGLEFEQFTADLLKLNGYSNVSVTKASGDHGIDVLASKGGISYAIQCKNYRRKLDNTPVQEAYAGKDFYHCDVGVVITNSTFTDGARELADAVGVLLWDRQTLQTMIHKAYRGRLFKRNKKADSPTTAVAEDPSSTDDIIVTTQEDLQSFMSTHTLVDTIHTKVVGVTFANDDGTSRQDVLALCSGGDEVALQYYEYNGAPAYAVLSWHGRIGSLSADIARTIDAAYDGAVVKCSISAITGDFDSHPLGCNLIIEVYKENCVNEDNDENPSKEDFSPSASTASIIDKTLSPSEDDCKNTSKEDYAPIKSKPARKVRQPTVEDAFIAESQWYAAHGGTDLVDDE